VKSPVQHKKKLVEDLSIALEAATLFCAKNGVHLDRMEQLPAGDLKRLSLLDDTVNALISPDPLRREFLGQRGWSSLSMTP
jgi:type I restriction enzyme R subunit